MAKEIINTGLTHNVIASGTKIIGTITADNDIRIDGNIEGDLICKGKIVVGTNGIIDGNITCNNAEIMGNINGKINVSDTLSLKSTSSILGEIKTKVLIIEPQAKFTGTCEMEKTGFSKSKSYVLIFISLFGYTGLSVDITLFFLYSYFGNKSSLKSNTTSKSKNFSLFDLQYASNKS